MTPERRRAIWAIYGNLLESLTKVASFLDNVLAFKSSCVSAMLIIVGKPMLLSKYLDGDFLLFYFSPIKEW